MSHPFILCIGETWRGRWQKNDIVAKILAVRECTPRIQRDFNEEFPKLRIFSHPNILPVVSCHLKYIYKTKTKLRVSNPSVNYVRCYTLRITNYCMANK